MKALVALILFSQFLIACEMSPQQRETMGRLAYASSCLTERGCDNQSNQKAASNSYNSAITVSATSICPMDLNMGVLSHSTVSGFNRICYYR